MPVCPLKPPTRTNSVCAVATETDSVDLVLMPQATSSSLQPSDVSVPQLPPKTSSVVSKVVVVLHVEKRTVEAAGAA